MRSESSQTFMSFGFGYIRARKRTREKEEEEWGVIGVSETKTKELTVDLRYYTPES